MFPFPLGIVFFARILFFLRPRMFLPLPYYPVSLMFMYIFGSRVFLIICIGALHRDSAAISGGGGEKLSPARAVQLLCRTRRDYAGLGVMKTKVSDRKALPHLAVRILTLPPIVIGVTLLLMYAPAGLLTRRELLLCEVFLLVIPLAAYPLREIFHIGKDRRRGQRRWVSVRVSLVNADTMLMARPYPVSLLCHFHRGAVAAQRGLWPSRKRTRLQYNSSGVSADMEAASAFCHTVRSADRSSVPLLPKAVAPYPAAASGRLGGQSAGLCDLDRGLWRRIKRYCAASPFHLTVARRSPVFIAASSIAAVLFCVILILEKRYHNSAGARMGSDHTSYGRIVNFFQFSLPDVTAVFDIL